MNGDGRSRSGGSSQGLPQLVLTSDRAVWKTARNLTVLDMPDLVERPVAVSMPSVSKLPAGPRRELTSALHDLYEAAGMPSTRRISEAISANDDFVDTVSHEAVRGVLLGSAACRWSKVECITRQLVTWAVTPAEVSDVLLTIHRLWIACERAVEQDSAAQTTYTERGIEPRNDPSRTEPPIVMGTKQTVDDEPGNSVGTRELVGRLDHPKLGLIEIFDRSALIQIIEQAGGSDE